MKEYNFLIAYKNTTEEPYRTVFSPLNRGDGRTGYVGFFADNKRLFRFQLRLRGEKAGKYFPAIKRRIVEADYRRLSGWLESLQSPGTGLCLITNQEFLLLDPDGTKIRQLKEQFPELKIVFYFSDLAKVHPLRKEVLANREKYHIDLIVSFDRKEAVRYDMLHSPLPYSLMEGIRTGRENEYDVCFIGRAKCRYQKILEAYDYFTGKGLSCCFFVITEGEKLSEIRKGIRYFRHAISYRSFLEYESRSRCILEIVQEGSSGYTSRVPEAVFLEKKLISDNTELLRDSLYGSGKIFVYTEIEELDPELLLKEDGRTYRQSDRDIFDVNWFLSFIGTELCRRGREM